MTTHTRPRHQPRHPTPTRNEPQAYVPAIAAGTGSTPATRAELHAVYDALSDIVCVTTFDGTLRFINRAGRDLLAFVDDDAMLIGSIFPAHTPAARALLLDEVIPDALRTGRASCDTALQASDGRIFPASQVVIVTPAQLGAPLTLTIVIRNVSIERQAAARLGESQRLFEMISRRAPDLICLFDPETQRVVWTNRCPHAFLGGTERDARTLSRRELLQLVHPDDLATFRETGARMAGSYGDGDSLSNEVRLRTPGAGWRWIQARTTVFSRRETGAPLLLLAVASVITARKRAEFALVAARDRALEAESARAEFVTRLTGELQGALNAITTSLAAAHGTPGASIAEQCSEAQLAHITARVQRLHALTTDLSDYTGIEAGSLEVQATPCDVTQVIRDTLAAFIGHSALERIVLHADCPAQCAPVLLDPSRLQQALTHLVANALAFTTHGGVTIRLVLDAQTHRPRSIDVVDTGVGIALERHASLFDPFAPSGGVSTATRIGSPGTGLGLPLAHALCEMLGCSLQLLESNGEAGTCFRIELPVPSRAAELAGAYPVAELTDATGNAGSALEVVG